MEKYIFKNGGTSITKTNICAVNSSGEMILANATDDIAATGQLGFALFDIEPGVKGDFLLAGYAYFPNSPLTPGKIHYLSTVSGGVTDTPPEGSNIVRPLGYAINEYILKFEPTIYQESNIPVLEKDEVLYYEPSNLKLPTTGGATLKNYLTTVNLVPRDYILFDDSTPAKAWLFWRNKSDLETQHIQLKLTMLRPAGTTGTDALIEIETLYIQNGELSDKASVGNTSIAVTLTDAEKEYVTLWSAPIDISPGAIDEDTMIGVMLTRNFGDAADTVTGDCWLIDVQVKTNVVGEFPIPVISDDMSSQANTESLGGVVDEVTYSGGVATFTRFSDANGCEINYGSKAAGKKVSLRFKITEYTPILTDTRLFGGFQTETPYKYNLVLSVENKNKIKIYVGSTTGLIITTTTIDMTIGDYVLVYDSGKVYLYKNGVMIWSDTTTLPDENLLYDGDELIIGGTVYPNRWITCKMDLFEWYDVALSASQIALL